MYTSLLFHLQWGAARSKRVKTTQGSYNQSAATGTYNLTVSLCNTNGVCTPSDPKSVTVSTSTITPRIIGYLPSWSSLPTASALKTAGYTHIVVAFAQFSTISPGTLYPGFVSPYGNVTASYIQQLQAQQIKVLLSIGGATTNIPNTSTSFHKYVPNNTAADALVTSIKNMVSTYGFDGVDFDLEGDATDGSESIDAQGTFTNPQGDIPRLAYIINSLRQYYNGVGKPDFLITLAPETFFIGANYVFADGSGATTYSSLIMQPNVASSLSWVAIQLYNSGPIFALNDTWQEYGGYNGGQPETSTDFYVTAVADLLENWQVYQPAFLPYVSPLRPDQVVPGFLATSTQASTKVDGDPNSPVVSPAFVSKIINCLRTGSQSCTTYKLPRAYPNIGGVFDWSTDWDRQNNPAYPFANGVKACVIGGNCSGS